MEDFNWTCLACLDFLVFSTDYEVEKQNFLLAYN